jgi:hypothetical protein
MYRDKIVQKLRRHPELDSGSIFFPIAAKEKVDAGSSPA